MHLSPLDLQLRLATADDQEFLVALYRSTRHDLLALTIDPALIDSLITMQQQAQATGYRHDFPKAEYLVLEYQGERLARVVVDSGPGAVHLIDLAVLPSAQRKGCATEILRRLQRQAATSLLPLTLSVNKNNAPARCLYLAMGFQIVSDDQLTERMIWRAG